MKNMILITNDAKGSLDSIRAKAVFDLVIRLTSLQDSTYKILEADKKQILQAISKLSGKLSFDMQQDKIVAQYIPSVHAKQQLMDLSINNQWDEGIIKKQQKLIRTTQGAIFRFPIENGNGTIDTFITDWSPFPVAAAIAVHKDHPAITNVKKGKSNYFTGMFVRHPLTGDFMPIFVADWVKPEFGTGAVIVNPAHNQADLDFARKIGLPIRFGLVLNDVTADPETWPAPPVIKMGHTIKTGRYDNLIPEEAVAKYFNELHEFGHADKFTDIGIGSYPIFELEASEEGDYVFNTQTGELCENMDGDSPSVIKVKLHVSSIFSQLSALEPDGDVEIISEAGEAGSKLLFARCLFNELYEKNMIPKQVIQVQKVQESKAIEGMDPETIKLLTMVQAPNNQPAVLKKQIIEQAERFINIHQEIKKFFETQEPEDKEINPEQYTKIKQLIVSANYQKAFNSIYTMQKNLYQRVKKENLDMQSIKLYFALTYVLLGDGYPDKVCISDEWNHI